MPSSLNRSLDHWPVPFSCRRASWKKAVGFILRGCLWAQDGPAIAARPATKACNRRIRNCGSFAIWVTLRAVRGCPKNGLMMRCDFRLLATRLHSYSFPLSVNPHTGQPAMERSNTMSRVGNGFPPTPTGAFRRWQNVTCSRICYGEFSPPRRVPVRIQLLESEPHERER